ncbi:hypothetical protein D3C72_2485160 [compost metagenome]
MTQLIMSEETTNDINISNASWGIILLITTQIAANNAETKMALTGTWFLLNLFRNFGAFP